MITVGLATAQETQTALELLWHFLPPRERAAQIAQFRGSVARGETSLDGLLLARDGTQPVGALLCVLQPDGIAFLWPPAVPDPARAEPVGDALLDAAAAWLDASSARLGQCLLEPEARDDRRRLERHGFRHLTDLLFLRKTFHGPAGTPTADWDETIPYSAAVDGRFVAVLERTYEQSQDCPAVNETRTAADALAAHKLTGTFDPDLWRLLSVAGEDIGLVLLSPHHDQRLWEVVYVGIVPAARRQGHAENLLRAGLAQAQAARAEGMFLAVDAANSPAVALYSKLEFDPVMRRSVHARVPGGSRGA